MSLLFLILGITASLLIVSAPLFELAFGVLLLTPIVWFVIALVAKGIGISIIDGEAAFFSYVGVIIVMIVSAQFFFGRMKKLNRSLSEYLSFVLFAATFVFALWCAHSWSDFIAMGERLRDYAILASTIKSPLEAREPWMSGVVLNYYVYWYRFGHFLHSVLGVDTWEIYHIMTAFALAFYCTAIFQVARFALGLSALLSLTTALIATFGSNVAGVIFWLKEETNWWGPSRVIRGAINEFPAWSFLLGDLHPHFLNLGVIPFGILLVYRALCAKQNLQGGFTKLIFAVGFLSVAIALWLFSSNAWEVPMWLGIVVTILAIAISKRSPIVLQRLKRVTNSYSSTELIVGAGSLLILVLGAVAPKLFLPTAAKLTHLFIFVISVSIFWGLFPLKREFLQGVKRSFRDRRSIVLFTVGLFFMVAFKISADHIIPEGGGIALVQRPIELTQLYEIAQHFGAPLLLAALGIIFLMPSTSLKILAGITIFGSVLFSPAIVFIYALLFLLVLRLVVPQVGKHPLLHITPINEWFSEALLIASLGLLILPEFVFLNDAYGGENERMNTIFKIYTVAWGLLILSSVSVFSRGFQSITYSLPKLSASALPTIGACAVSLGLFLPFFFHTAALRRPGVNVPRIEPVIEGLSEVEMRFPGSSAAIRFLRAQEPSVVLEGQGNAYDYTTFVTSLAGQTAYLGWSNHVNLLDKRYLDGRPVKDGIGAEVGRRERVTEQIYNELACAERLKTAQAEGIDFIVLGVREEEKYAGVSGRDFTCFKEVLRDQRYRIFEITS